MVEVIPGILEQEFSEIEKKVALVQGLVDWVQIDVADGTLVPNTTFLDFSALGTLTKSSLSSNLSTVNERGYDHRLSFEAHLMVTSPEKYIRPLVDAGFRRLIAHVEANDPRRFLDEAQYESIEVGLAIDGATDFNEIEPFLEAIDVVLVMTIEAGFSGSPFLPEAVEKMKTIHRNLPDLPIEGDGGINEQTARLVKEAGATRLVSTSFLFKDPKQIAATIDTLRKA